MQLNESRRPALFPSRKCYINVSKIDKNTNPPKATRSGKQLFFPYPSVFAKSYVRCAYHGSVSIFCPECIVCLLRLQHIQKHYSLLLSWKQTNTMVPVRLLLALNAPITTKVFCFSRLLKCLGSLYGKQCGPRSDCSYRSSLFWVHAICFYT